MLYLAIEWVDFFHGGLLNYQMVIILMMNGKWDMNSPVNTSNLWEQLYGYFLGE